MILFTKQAYFTGLFYFFTSYLSVKIYILKIKKLFSFPNFLTKKFA